MGVINTLVVLTLALALEAADHMTPHEYEFWIKTATSCTQEIYEGDTSHSTYSDLKTKLEDGIKAAYTNNTKYFSARVKSMQCTTKPHYVAAKIMLIMTGHFTFDEALADLKNEIMDNVLDGSALNLTDNMLRASMDEGAKPKEKVTLKFSFTNELFCKNMAALKVNLAKRVILSDGMKRLESNRIVVYEHECNEEANKYKKAVMKFYIYDDNDFLTADAALTNLAYQVVDQLQYDGTAWKLGVIFHKHINDVDYESESEDEDFTEIEKTYIGFGAVVGLLLLIVIIVLFVSCICPNACGKQEDPYLIEDRPSRFTNVNTHRDAYSNQVYSKEEYANGYEREVEMDTVLPHEEQTVFHGNQPNEGMKESV